MRRFILGLLLLAVVAMLPQSASANDDQIAQAVVAQLQTHKQQGTLRDFDIKIDVEQGKVWVKGRVNDQTQHDLTLATVRRVEGVKLVVDGLAVGPAAGKQSLLNNLGGAFQRAVGGSREASTTESPAPGVPALASQQVNADDANGFGVPIPPGSILGPFPAKQPLPTTPLASDQNNGLPSPGGQQAIIQPARQSMIPAAPAQVQPTQTQAQFASQGVGFDQEGNPLRTDSAPVRVRPVGQRTALAATPDISSQRAPLPAQRRQPVPQGYSQYAGMQPTADPVSAMQMQQMMAMQRQAQMAQMAQMQQGGQGQMNYMRQAGQGQMDRRVPGGGPGGPPSRMAQAGMALAAAPLAPLALASGQMQQMQQAGNGPVPTYVPGTSGGVAPARYDHPNLPNYAWPTYAASPNYAALTYPRQYSPTAWPYIGPFYPYPQVPLGWRKVTLEWDDGWWFLDFKSK